MLSFKRVHYLLLAITVILTFFSLKIKPSDGAPHVLSLQGFMVTDLSDHQKNTFSPGDGIRYRVQFSSSIASLFFATGRVSFEGAETRHLPLQFATLRAGEHSIFWDSIVPTSAQGNATVTVNLGNVPGRIFRASVSFTVKEQGIPSGTEEFIGSVKCILCHNLINQDLVDAFNESGHAHALKKLTGNTPEYPDFSPAVPLPPEGFNWADFSYIIGGYGWCANFIKQDGYLLTNSTDGVDAKYNLPSTVLDLPGAFVPYEEEQAEPKPFDCAPCHTTGYILEGNQGNRPGIVGTWAEEGVGCEACHGPGSEHKKDPTGVLPPLDPEKTCSRCHAQNDALIVEAEDGLILNGQQTAELASGGKSFFKCTTCHDPHASTHYDEVAAGAGRIIYHNEDCTSCHSDKTIGMGMQNLMCIDCHMPYAVKSGTGATFEGAEGIEVHVGTMRSHVFTINAEAESPSEMFEPDGKSLAAGGITLDFACLRCHREGGEAQRAYTYKQVREFAKGVH